MDCQHEIKQLLHTPKRGGKKRRKHCSIVNFKFSFFPLRGRRRDEETNQKRYSGRRMQSQRRRKKNSLSEKKVNRKGIPSEKEEMTSR